MIKQTILNPSKKLSAVPYNKIFACFNSLFPQVFLFFIVFFNVGTLSGVYLFDHPLWSIFQSSITHNFNYDVTIALFGKEAK